MVVAVIALRIVYDEFLFGVWTLVVSGLAFVAVGVTFGVDPVSGTITFPVTIGRFHDFVRLRGDPPIKVDVVPDFACSGQ